MKKNIKSIASYFSKKYNTNNPFDIADALKIEYLIGPLGKCSGCYMYIKRHRCIFLNDTLSYNELKYVMAHELGHAILHTHINCYFIKNKTLFSTSRIEREANIFATELLIPDSVIYENEGFTDKQIARLLGYNETILKFKQFGNPLQ